MSHLTSYLHSAAAQAQQFTSQREIQAASPIEALTQHGPGELSSQAGAKHYSASALARIMKRLEAAGTAGAYKPQPGVTAWRAPELLHLLDDFAATLGRRNTPST